MCVKVTQVVTQPINIDGGHIFMSTHQLCSQVVSVAAGCSLTALTQKTNKPESAARVVSRRSYERFNAGSFLNDVKDSRRSRKLWNHCFEKQSVKLVDRRARL